MASTAVAVANCPAEKSKIPVAVIDYYQEPMKNTVASTRLLGQLLDREEKAEAVIDFYQQHMAALTERLKGKDISHPRVLLNAYPGMWDCCWSSGTGGPYEFISFFRAKISVLISFRLLTAGCSALST